MLVKFKTFLLMLQAGKKNYLIQQRTEVTKETVSKLYGTTFTRKNSPYEPVTLSPITCSKGWKVVHQTPFCSVPFMPTKIQ
jgi:hypothetical protein